MKQKYEYKFVRLVVSIALPGILIACSPGEDKTASRPVEEYPDSIDEILAQPHDLDIIFALQRKINRKEKESGFESLTEGEKVFLCVEELEMEVNNGGFAQYFYNPSGDRAQDAAKAFEAIGAKHTAEIVRKACSIFPDGKPPKDFNERISVLAEIDENELDPLNQLDGEFYEYEENLTALLIEYVRKSKSQFE